MRTRHDGSPIADQGVLADWLPNDARWGHGHGVGSGGVGLHYVRPLPRHFYEHWAGRKPIVNEREFEAILDADARPGAFRASIAYYRARWAETSADRTTDDESVIEQPTVVGWGDADPVMVSAWSDRLRETFPDHELARFPGIGHFVPLEAPEQTIDTIRRALELSVRPERS